jgi:arsenate reductase (thioredoxin)
MLVLGLQGSPRRKGNTSTLLSTFLDEAQRLGADTDVIDVPRRRITPCQECGNCEKEGFCPIDDEMQEVYPLLREADIIVMGTPVFFYGPTAQLKCLIDRSQALWSRRYVLKLEDPGRRWRRGLLLSVGATKGKDLFVGINLTAKYFFDAVGARFDDGLTYIKVEGPDDIIRHPSALEDARQKARLLVLPLLKRKKILFVCTENACRSQMAAAFAQYYGGDIIEAKSAGSAPAKEINPVMEEVMRERGIDMAWRRPKSLIEAEKSMTPELIVTMGCQDACPMFPGAENMAWDLPDPAGRPIEFMRGLRDDIEMRVSDLVKSI